MITRIDSIRAIAPRTPRTGLISRILLALSIRKERATLVQLDARILKDIGISESEVLAESSRSVWDAPERFM